MKPTGSIVAGITAASFAVLAYLHSMAAAVFESSRLSAYAHWANVVAVLLLVAAVPAAIVATVMFGDDRADRRAERKAKLDEEEFQRRKELIRLETESWRERFGKK